MNLTECRRIIADHDATINRQCIPLAELRFDRDVILAGEKRLGLTLGGIKHLCRHIGAPYQYVSAPDRDVRAMLLAYHFTRGDFGRSCVALISKGDEFLALDQPDLLTLPGADVLEAATDGHDPDTLAVHDVQFFGESLQLDLLYRRLDIEVLSGDVLQAGLRISHSLVGDHATLIESFVLRLLCSNGLTHRDCVSRHGARTRRLSVHVPRARELQRDQIRRLSAEAWTTLARKLDSLKHLQDERVEFEGLLSRWLERARLLAARFMPLLRGAWQLEGSQPTVYGAVNALSRVATHAPEITLRQRRVLSGLAGLLAFRRMHLCPRCFAMLSGPDPSSGNAES